MDRAPNLRQAIVAGLKAVGDCILTAGEGNKVPSAYQLPIGAGGTMKFRRKAVAKILVDHNIVASVRNPADATSVRPSFGFGLGHIRCIRIVCAISSYR